MKLHVFLYLFFFFFFSFFYNLGCDFINISWYFLVNTKRGPIKRGDVI